MKIGRRDILFLAIALLPSLAVAASALLLVPSSIAVYAPVADHLPPQTQFVFSFYYLCALWPALVVLVWYFWRSPKDRGPMAASIGVLGSIAIGAFGWWAVYQPDLILELIERSAG